MTANSMSGHCNSPYILSHRLSLGSYFTECLMKVLVKFKSHSVHLQQDILWQEKCNPSLFLYPYDNALASALGVLIGKQWNQKSQNTTSTMSQLSRVLNYGRNLIPHVLIFLLYLLNFPPSSYFENFQLNRKIIKG